MIDPILKEQIEEEVWNLTYPSSLSDLQSVPDRITCFENLSNDLKFKMAWDEFGLVFFDYCFFCAKEQAYLNKFINDWLQYSNDKRRKIVYKDRVHRFYHSKITKILSKAYQDDR